MKTLKTKKPVLLLLLLFMLSVLNTNAQFNINKVPNPITKGTKEKEKTITDYVSVQKIKGTLVHPNGKHYFFTDKRYFRYSKANGLEKIANTKSNWSGIPDNIDAVFVNPKNKKAYFFKGSSYYRYNFKEKGLDNPRLAISRFWKGVPNNVDAVTNHPNGKIYFFKGDTYYRYDSKLKKVDRSGLISKNWKGVPNNIAAALLHKNGKIYFFKGNKYYRYNTKLRKVEWTRTIGSPGWKELDFDKKNFTKKIQSNNTTTQAGRKFEKINSNFREGYKSNTSNRKKTSNSSKICITEKLKINANTKDFKIFTNAGAPNWVMPGVVLEASSLIDGSDKIILRERHPITIASTVVGGGSASKKVQNPEEASNIRTAVRNFSNDGGKIAANLSFKYSEIRSVEELELYLTGTYSNKMAGIKAELNMNSSTKRESFYYMVDFTQNMFSLDVNGMTKIFKDDLPYNENDVYVSRVNYGRRGIVIVKSKLDFKSFGLDVEASMKNLLGGDASLKAGIKTLNRNESFEIKAFFYGGTSSSAVRSFNTMMKTKKVNILEWLEDKSGDIGYALPISYQLKNLKNEKVGIKDVFSQNIKTCVPIPQENVRLKVTLTKVGCEQGRDNKGLFADGNNPDDYGIQQWMNYKVNGKFKKSSKSERIIRVNKSLLKAKENSSPWKNRNIIILGNKTNQIHIREGEKKRINNSIVFNIKSNELADSRATFRIHTWLKEYTGSEDIVIANDEFIDVKINEVMAYLLDPSSFGDDYFNEEVRSGNGYISFHNYGAKDAVMWMRDGGNGSLLGEVAYSFRNSDMHMRTRFFLRFEIIK